MTFLMVTVGPQLFKSGGSNGLCQAEGGCLLAGIAIWNSARFRSMVESREYSNLDTVVLSHRTGQHDPFPGLCEKELRAGSH